MISNIFEHSKPMHMTRINSRWKFLLSAFVLMLFSAGPLLAQNLKLDIKGTGADDYEGCEDYFVEFMITVQGAATTVDSVELISGDRLEKFIRHDEWNVTGRVYRLQIALKAGTYNPIARIKRDGNSTWEEAILTKAIKVYTNPVALFKITSDSAQCFEGNSACFEDISRMGKEGHKLVDTVFDVGSGDIIRQGTFCYTYPAPGVYDIVLTVKDEKGCSDEYVGKSRMEIYPAIGADFRVVGPVGCPCTDIRFNNRTKFDQDKIDWWVWDWGTSKKSMDTFYMDTPDHKLNWWTGFTRQYCKDGYHSPKLIVVAKDGCRDSILLKDAIRVVNFKFDITWIPDTSCFTGNNVRFNMPPRPNATQLLWVFGDPLSMNLNVNREDWSPGHQYVGGPGFYNVSFTVLEPPCPVRDTTICFVKLKGPTAAINLPNPPFSNNCRDPREIPKEDFLRLKYDECFRESAAAMDPAADEINWVTVNSTNRSVKEQFFVYCNAPIDSYSYVVDISANGMGDAACGTGFTIANEAGWVKKDIFKRTFIDSANNRWKVTKENFRPSGVRKYMLKGETVKYDGTTFTATKNGWQVFYCDSFYFEKTDSIPVNTVVLDSIPVYEPPIGEGGLIAAADGYVANPFFRKEGVAVYLNKGESVDYRLDGNDFTFTATKNGVETIIADEFYFFTGDTMRESNGNFRNRYQEFTQSATTNWKWSDPMPYEEKLTIKDFITPVGGGPKVETTFDVFQPFLGVHELEINGVAYIYRITETPITHVGGTYRPPMYPGTTPAVDGCGDEWRTMHDTDKFTRNCGAPNLVTFTNNSSMYRMFGRAKSDVPAHTSYDLDNKSAALSLGAVDSCTTNPNFPWASDSMYYLWSFGDDGDQCTTYLDINKDIQVKGNNPSGDPLRCLFSEIVAPQHYYTSEGCWTSVLTVIDPVTGCTATAQQPIVMEAPDGGPADPLGAARIEDVNYYNQTVFQQDENTDDFRMGVRLGQGAPPCVGNDLNPYFQRIDVSATLPACGRETFWMIFNRDDPHQDPNDDTDDNDCEKNECTIDGNGSLIKKEIVNRGALHQGGNYAVEWRVDNGGTWGPALAKGVAKINPLGFLDNVSITDDLGGAPNLAKARMVFVDSSSFNATDVKANPIVAYGYEQVDSFWYECNWIPEMILQLIGMQWSYTTPGCKTPGIVIKVGDCFDTFFYENYRYFLDANGDFLINPHPQLYTSEEQIRDLLDPLDKNPVRDTVYEHIEHIVCTDPDPLDDDILPLKLPYNITLSVKDYRRNDPLPAGGDPVCDARDSIRTFAYFISKNANQCGPVTNGVFVDSVDMMPAGFDVISGGNPTLVNLRDTIQWTARTPGKYVISTQSRAKHGPQFCFGLQAKEIWIGQLQCFRFDDSVLCKEQTVTFIDSIYYWDPRGTAYCELINWWENTTCIDTNKFFYSPDSNVARNTWHDNPAVRWRENTNVKYTNDLNINEMIAWDFNTPRYVTDKNGDFVLNSLGQKIRMEDWRLKMDMKRMEIVINPDDSSYEYQTNTWKSDSIFRIDTLYRIDSPSVIDTIKKVLVDIKQRTRETQWTYGTTPEFGVGVYDVTLWARDSMGCWMPYTKHDAIRVVGVEAQFTLCDTCQDTLVCTPSATAFKDSSIVLENEEDVPSGESLTKGKFDEIIKWKWDFGDGRDRSVLQNPAHTYLDANEAGYDVTLWVVTAQGCKSEIEKPKYIKVVGPQAKFGLVNDTICAGDSIELWDSSYSKLPATRIWSGNDVKDGATKSKRNTENDNNDVVKIRMYFGEPGDYYIIQQISSKVNDPITGVEKDCDDFFPNYDADEDSIFVHVRGLDSIKIDLNDTLFCPGDPMIAKVDLTKTHPGYDTFFWKIDTIASTEVASKVHEFTYTDEGKYVITLGGSGPDPICPTTDTATLRVKSVSADIEINDANSNKDLGNYEFDNLSKNGKLHIWEIFESTDTKNPIATFKRNDVSSLKYADFVAGDYIVKMTVYDVENEKDTLLGCRAVDTLTITVDPQIEFFNYFSPNRDGVNDVWSITMQAVPEYELVIYNRWGERMYKTDQDNDDDVICEENANTGKRACQFWDGTTLRGRPAPPGTYYFVFKYRFKGDDELTTVNGSITLVRGRNE